MKRWAQQIESQRRRYRERSRASNGSRIGGTSATEFMYMQNQPALENPYADQAEDEDEDEEEDDVETLVASGAPSWQVYPGKSDSTQSRNGSTSSIRSRSTTGDSGGPTPVSAAATSRAPPPGFPQGSFTQPQQQPSLAVRTRDLHSAVPSPGDRAGDSYFSPTTTGESPMVSSRTSSSSGTYPFPRQGVPQNGYYEDGHGHTRYTAPAMGRPSISQREPSVTSNGYAPPGRGPRPGFPAGLHSAQQMPTIPRNRSASSPDIHNGQRPPQPMRSGPGQPPVPDMPAAYQQHHPHMAPRSQSNSPNLQNGAPTRNSPQLQRERSHHSRHPQDPSPTNYPYDPLTVQRPDTRMGQYPGSRNGTPVPGRGIGNFSPPPPTSTPATPMLADGPPPTQLKVKVHCPSASQTLTLVVPLNISCQSLKDRIDAKLQRSTNMSLSDRGPKEQVKLKYLDEEDYVSIQSDEDVQTAFETWREQRGEGIGGMGEIELFCQR